MKVNKDYIRLFNWLLLLLYFSTPFLLYWGISKSYGDREWLIFLIGAMFGIYGSDLIKTLSRREIFWTFKSKKDKIAFFISLSSILVSILIPIELQWPLLFLLISLLAGYALSWLIIRFGGTKELKDKMLWPKL